MLLTIFGAVLGAILSIGIPIAVEHYQYRRRSDLMGDWFATWQPSYDPIPNWVEEKLSIKVRFGKLHFTNSENTGFYEWEGRGQIMEGRFITGKWHSTKKGAHASGAFMLALNSEGDFLCGYFLGENIPGSRMTGAFAIGRTKQDMEKAKLRLLEVGKRFIKDMKSNQTAIV